MYKSLSKLKSLFFILVCLELIACTQSPAQIITYNRDSTYVKNSEQNPYVVWVKPGDTVYSIAKSNDVDLRSLIDLNHFNAPYILQNGQRVTLPKPTFHIAKQGENIYAISRIYNTDANSLAQANHLQISDNLTDGQKLRIPSSITTNSDNGQIRENSEANSQNNYVPYNDNQNKSPTNYNVASNDLPAIQSPKSNGPEEIQEPTNNSNAITTKPNNNDTSGNKSSSAKAAKSQYYEDDLDEEIIASRKPNKQQTNNTEATKITGNPGKIASSDNPVLTNKTSNGKTTVLDNKAPSFIWPVGGKVISRFGPKKGGLYNDGINISAKEGAAVKAADAGTVVYAGNELKGYGNLILIKHKGGYLTAYAHNEELLVKKGDIVKRGQIISHVGQTGLVSSPQLHFSIRQGRKILDPETQLPASKIG